MMSRVEMEVTGLPAGLRVTPPHFLLGILKCRQTKDQRKLEGSQTLWSLFSLASLRKRKWRQEQLEQREFKALSLIMAAGRDAAAC